MVKLPRSALYTKKGSTYSEYKKASAPHKPAVTEREYDRILAYSDGQDMVKYDAAVAKKDDDERRRVRSSKQKKYGYRSTFSTGRAGLKNKATTAGKKLLGE